VLCDNILLFAEDRSKQFLLGYYQNKEFYLDLIFIICTIYIIMV
jgi:hypothetical protein